MSSNFVIQVSREGASVESATLKQTAFSTQFDCLKVAYSGSLTVILPSETITGDSIARTATYSHGLGYTPLFLPLNLLAFLDPDATSTQIFNDVQESDLLEVGGADPYAEFGHLFITNESITFRVSRFDTGAGHTFGAHDATVYFVLLYNELDSAFDLL